MWKEIPGYEGYYAVSDTGEVKSLQRTITTKSNQTYTIPERILKATPVARGYLQVMFCKDNVKKAFYVHRLVAEAFIENPNNEETVNHKDGNKLNNNANNLEWVSYSENNQHAYDTNLHKKGEGHYKAKLTEEDVKQIRKEYPSVNNYNKLAQEYGVSRATIRDIVLKKTWKNVL